MLFSKTAYHYWLYFPIDANQFYYNEIVVTAFEKLCILSNVLDMLQVNWKRTTENKERKTEEPPESGPFPPVKQKTLKTTKHLGCSKASRPATVSEKH